MKLQVSSDKVFYSIQCEGKTVGVPAVFFRLAGCTLNCHWCDTAEVWKARTDMTFEEVWELFVPYVSHLNEGAHLILTGGSPLRQTATLVKFFEWLRKHYPHSQSWFVECETEGVLSPEDLGKYVQQWNVSPKLANSGMDFHRRFIPTVLREHVTSTNSIFKFPVNVAIPIEEQLDEIAAIRAMCGIPKRTTYLMPVCDNQKDHRVNLPIVVELAKSNGYCVSPRLHLEIWDKTTGV